MLDLETPSHLSNVRLVNAPEGVEDEDDGKSTQAWTKKTT